MTAIVAQQGPTVRVRHQAKTERAVIVAMRATQHDGLAAHLTKLDYSPIPLGADAVLIAAKRAKDEPLPSWLHRVGRSVVEALSKRSSGVRIGMAHVVGDRDAGAVRALTDARHALLLSRDTGPIVIFEDVIARAALAQDLDLRNRLAAVLDPLDHDTRVGRQLLGTLSAYFSHPTVAAAARNLGVHRHTLEYRIHQIEGILGRTIRYGPDRFLIEAALEARSLARREPGKF